MKSYNVNTKEIIEIKVTEQYFPALLLILKLWTKSLRETIQVKAFEQYFPVVLWIIHLAIQTVLAFGSAEESVTIPNEVTLNNLSRVTVYYAVQKVLY